MSVTYNFRTIIVVIFLVVFRVFFVSSQTHPTTPSTTPFPNSTPIMVRPLDFPQLVVASYWSLPYSYKIPVVMLISTLTVLGIRELDQWVRKLRKDPVSLLCQALLCVSVAAIACQLVYLGIASAVSPVTTLINTTVDALAEIPYPVDLPQLNVTALVVTAILASCGT